MTSAEIAAENRLRPYVPELLLGWPADLAWQVLDGTLVSADISGFTALSERLASRGKEGAEELSTLICDCFDGMIDDTLGRGGDIIKFGGDALLIWFQGDDHAERAASAAIAMRATMRRERRTSDGRKVPLAVSIGLNSGPHHFIQINGNVADLVITGPGATATVRAESDAHAGMILATAATAALLPAAWLGDEFESGVVLKRRLPNPPGHATQPPSWRRAPSHFIPPEQLDLIEAGITNEHRQVAVAFLAFGGADGLVDSGNTAQLARHLQQVTATVVDACGRNGTFLLATDVAPDGGKFVIASGAPRAVGHNEDRLLRTLREVVDADPGLRLHAGINRGSLFAGDLGSSRRRVYTTLGDSTNLAARLCAKAGDGQVVVSRVAMEWSSVEFEVVPIPPFHVKGKANAVHAGLLGAFVGRRPEQFATDGPVIGRVEELARLRALISESRDGTSRAAAIVGLPGVGKTRLLAELSHQEALSQIVTMRCSALDRLRGRSAIVDVLRSLLGLAAYAPAAEILARVHDIITAHFPRSVALLPLLGPVLDIEVEETSESALVPVELRATRTAQLLVECISSLVRDHTIVLIDDAQHADEPTSLTVNLLCSAGLDLPLCTVIVTTRDRAPDCEVIEVLPLPSSDAATLIEGLIGDAELSSETVRDILARSDGNPMYATEIVSAVLNGSPGVPDSLDAAIEIRLDRLDPVDRTVLRTAAVLGAEVHVALLSELVDGALLVDLDRWDRLDEFLERVGPGVMRFRFDAHRRVAYDALPFRTRRSLHRKLLQLLEAVPGEPGRERLATMAHHAGVSGDDALTWRHATAAAESTAELGLFGEAAQLYRLAWGARRAAKPAQLAPVAERFGDVLEIAGDFTAANEALSRAQALAMLPIDRSRLLRKRGDIAERQGDYRRAHLLYRRASRELDATNWATALSERAQLDCARSGLALRQANYDDAWRFGNLALSQAERVGDWATAAHAALMVDNLITQMSWSGVQVTRPDVLGLHQRAGDLLGAAKWLSNSAVDRYYEGAWDEAIVMYREAADQCVRFGHLVSEATALNNIAEIESDRGRYDEARSLLRAARRSWRAIGFGVGIALAQSNLGRLATRTGQHDEAAPLLTDAIERFNSLGMTSMAADARLRFVENLLLSGAAVSSEHWPQESMLDEDLVEQVYCERLRAVERAISGDLQTAATLVEATVEKVRTAQLPFDLVMTLRTRQAITGAGDDAAEIDELHQQLGIRIPPPIPAFAR